MTKKASKGKWGGARKNSGRRKNPQREEFLKIYEDIKNHANEKVGMKDKKSGKIIKKKRIMFLLDTLYTLAINEKSIYAIKEYLDRSIGKSRQYIEVDEPAQDNHLQTLNELRDIGLKQLQNAEKPKRKPRKRAKRKSKKNSK